MAAKGRQGFEVALQGADVQALWVVDGPGAVRHRNDFAAIQLQQLCSPSAHIAKPLQGREGILLLWYISVLICVLISLKDTAMTLPPYSSNSSVAPSAHIAEPLRDRDENMCLRYLLHCKCALTSLILIMPA